IHFINNQTFVTVFEKQILMLNLKGEILEKAPNPIELKKLKYNHFIAKNNYAVKEDVFYTPDGYNKMLFIRDFSSTRRELIEIEIPELGGLRSLKDKYNANEGKIIDADLFFINKDKAVIAEAYFSMSDKSHGKVLP